jgi:hypothetical protein
MKDMMDPKTNPFDGKRGRGGAGIVELSKETAAAE